MGRVKDSDLLENLQEKGVWSGAAPGEKRKRNTKNTGKRENITKKKEERLGGMLCLLVVLYFPLSALAQVGTSRQD